MAYPWVKLQTVIFLIIFAPAFTWAEDSITGEAKVKDVDTLFIGGIEVRLYGVDGVETKQKCRNKKTGEIWACGYVSTHKLEELIGDNLVTRHKAKGKDRWKRFLGKCFINTDKGKVDIGEALVSTGWARAYETYSLRYTTSEYMARFTGSGIWSSHFINPWDWRKMRKGKMKKTALY